MMQYHIIATDEDDIQLNVGVGEKGNYYMPSLTFKHESGNLTKDLYWDNPDYIFGNFKEFLIRWEKRSLLSEDNEEFKDIIKYLDGDAVKQLLEMLDLAIKQGWYDTI